MECTCSEEVDGDCHGSAADLAGWDPWLTEGGKIEAETAADEDEDNSEPMGDEAENGRRWKYSGDC